VPSPVGSPGPGTPGGSGATPDAKKFEEDESWRAKFLLKVQVTISKRLTSTLVENRLAIPRVDVRYFFFLHFRVA